MQKLKLRKKLKTEMVTKLKQQQNAKSQIAAKNSNTQIFMELKNLNWYRPQTQIVTKPKRSNSYNPISNKT